MNARCRSARFRLQPPTAATRSGTALDRRRRTTALTVAATWLLLTVFTLQNLATVATPLWAPRHYHVATPAAEPQRRPESARIHGEGAGAHRQGKDAGFESDEPLPPADAHAHAHAHAVEHHHPVAGQVDRPVWPARPGVSVRKTAGDTHHHDRSQRGVVYVDARPDPSPLAAAVIGFDNYWSILPVAVLVVLDRRKAVRTGLIRATGLSIRQAPLQRPPRARILRGR